MKKVRLTETELTNIIKISKLMQIGIMGKVFKNKVKN